MSERLPTERAPTDWKAVAMQRRTRRRYRNERLFRWAGLGAVVLSAAFLAFLLISVVSSGAQGFRPSPFFEQRAAFVRLDASGKVQSALPSGQPDRPEPLPDVEGLRPTTRPRTVASVGSGGPRYRVLGIQLGDGTLFAAISLADVDRTVDSAARNTEDGVLSAQP